jgi:hypothetical protein
VTRPVHRRQVAELRASLAQALERVAELERQNALLTATTQALQEDLDHRTGELAAVRARLREEITARAASVQRVEALERELSGLAGDVLVADVKRQKRGLLRRTPKAPSARPSASPPSTPSQAAPAGALAERAAGEELEALLERRLFGV